MLIDCTFRVHLSITFGQQSNQTDEGTGKKAKSKVYECSTGTRSKKRTRYLEFVGAE